MQYRKLTAGHPVSPARLRESASCKLSSQAATSQVSEPRNTTQQTPPRTADCRGRKQQLLCCCQPAAGGQGSAPGPGAAPQHELQPATGFFCLLAGVAAGTAMAAWGMASAQTQGAEGSPHPQRAAEPFRPREEEGGGITPRPGEQGASLQPKDTEISC